MANRTSPRTTGALGIRRALLGLAVLTALIAGVPYLLLAFGHQPTELTGEIDLLAQDDGTLLFVVVTCIGWAAWAAFTLSALLEIGGLLRRRPAPRIKGLGGMQSLAAFLLGSLVLLAPTAASAATPAYAATSVHIAAEGPSSTPRTVSSTANEAEWPQHTVTSATELPWDLAEEYLGDGKRWKDIAALNPQIPQLAAGDQYLPKGAVINLPADAQPVAPATHPTPETKNSPHATTSEPETSEPRHTPNPLQDVGSGSTRDGDERPTSVTVREGDSLWTIAAEHGDPEDWPVIYEANKGEPLPGGGRFDNPNLIVPGQQLDLPQAATNQPSARPDTSTPTTPDKPEDKQPDQKPAPDSTPQKDIDKDTAASNPATPAAPSTPASSAPSAPASATPTPSTTTPTAVPTPAQAGQKADSTQQTKDADQALAPAAVWMGAGTLAAALIGTLTTRRILQQRRRRPGRRIPMPTGSAATTEQGLRSVQHPTGFDLLDATLRTLALNLAEADRDLPVVTAVVLHEHKVELHLDQNTPPMKPFSGTAGRTDLWTCTASSPDLADQDALQGADAPYPALVSLGWDASGRLALVDLEYIGVLHLDGDPDHARHVLQAIAVELASTPLPGHLEITALADTAPGLDDAAPERVARTNRLADAVAELTSHTIDQQRALAALGAPTLRTARLQDDAGGSWTPHILLAAELPEGTETEGLLDLITTAPRVAGAVVTSSENADLAPHDGWTLQCAGPDETIVLPGSSLPIKLQGLSDPHFADAIELLTLSSSTTDVPAHDAWLDDLLDPDEELEEQDHQEPDHRDSSDDPQENDEEEGTPAPPADADEDGMPAEYSDIEQEELDTTQTENAEPTHETGEAPAHPAAHTADDDRQADSGTGDPTRADLFDPPPAPLLASAPVPASTDPAKAAPALTNEEPDATEEDPAANNPPSPSLPVPGPTPNTDSAEELSDTAPAVLLLGPVTIKGAAGRIDSNRISAAVELVSYLALNPGGDHHAIDDALWPGRLVNKQMRNAVISRTRSWLGKNTDGDAYFPRVQDTGDSRYRLASAVTCDWRTFQVLARTGLARNDDDGDLDLRRALALVRGRPFAAIDPQRYAWAEPAVQEMVSAIADVAYELSTRRREAADYTGALWAAHQGLVAAEENELLHRQVFLAHHGAGDVDALREAAARLARINESLGGGVDMEAETAQLLRTLLPNPVSIR
ncbi:LysM peptidoglycan-binding domain-containing protein [Streptomyces gardneri]|uniref:LysM peptidoglycan-binding domain-containing protein n=1 Tax=Streptomyces gardneri TaxID=66892 RepID=UPI0035DB1592